jgi:hypothetical protein
MTGGILNDDERKANLSFAWLAALASLSGYTCERGAQPDVSSVDAVVRTGRPPDGQIDVQLKATSSPDVKADGLYFQLRNPNYDHLRAPQRFCPIILAVLELPAHSNDWYEWDTEQLVLRRRAWWQSLRGYREITGNSRVVVLPEAQLLSPDTLQRLMNLSVQGNPVG